MHNFFKWTFDIIKISNLKDSTASQEYALSECFLGLNLKAILSHINEDISDMMLFFEYRTRTDVACWIMRDQADETKHKTI